MKYLILLLIILPGALSHPAYACPPKDSVSRAAQLAKLLKHPSLEYIMVVAHRGDWRNAPENSLPAIQLCLAMGVDIVEIDVRRTKDSAFILMHDKTLDRTSTGTGKIAAYNLQALRQLHLKNGYGTPTREVIPTLEEALWAVKDKALLFIDKGYDHIAEIYPLLEKTGTQHQVLFEGKASMKQLALDYPLLKDKILYQQRVAPDSLPKHQPLPACVIVNQLSATLPGFATTCAHLQQQGCNVMASTLWASTCDGHDDDAALTNADANWGWVLRQGINMICTDRPLLLLEYLRTKNKHRLVP